MKKVEGELADPSIYENNKKEKLRELMQQQGEFKKKFRPKKKNGLNCLRVNDLHCGEADYVRRKPHVEIYFI